MMTETFDPEVAPECPATADEHSLYQITGYPTGPSGRCDVWLVCECCGEEICVLGSDSVL